MTLRHAALMLLALALAESAHAHNGVLRGRVLDQKTRAPLVGANVLLLGTSRGAATDTDGVFVIGAVPTGTYVVSASAVGYVKQTRTVVIGTDTANATFQLAVDVLSFGEITATAERPYSAASSMALRSIDFELRPRQSAQDMLRMVPGLIIAQHAGGGKAEQIFLRGFDADHGTDVNLSLDGLPVNMVSHAHGQGYADLHFVIPEVVKGIEVFKGPYFAQFGDFATAGSVRFLSRDELESNLVSFEGGQFGEYRYLTALQLPLQSSTTTAYAAAEFFHTDGYFDSPSAFNRYNLFAKVRSQVNGAGTLDLWMSGFASGWNASGQIPERAVAEGLIDRFGSIDPSEGGTTQRENLSLSYSGTAGNSSTILTQLYYTRYRFKLFSDFTFFRFDPVNGDEIEQDDDRTVLGGAVEYSLLNESGAAPGTTVFGSSFRADESTVELWHTAQRRRLDNTASALIHQKNVSIYAQQELRFSSMLRLQLGVRGDYFLYDLEDQLRDSAHVDISGFVQQTVLNPKVNLVYSPSRKVDLFLDFGGGFHSNDARAVVAHPDERTLPRAWGAELGATFTPLDGLSVSAVAWGLDLQSELVYNGDDGQTEPSGRTRRVGLDLEGRSQVLSWLYADADVTFSRGRFRDMSDGQNYIPLAPSFTATGGLTVREPSGFEGSIRARHIDDRPANEDNSITARGYTVFDATVAYTFPAYRLQLSGENIFNVHWNEAQFDTESRLRGEANAVSDLHFTPGTPISLKLKVEYRF
ncbi:MAG TPA: TonB-dependent receptor [Bacteroidota bacterium]|nr:TonB-dependent receptor [Bacteroidota bacterium]